MSRNVVHVFFLVGLTFAFACALAPPAARADQMLTINPSSSVVNASVQLGVFLDDEGNSTYPSGPQTGQQYYPGSINPTDNTPVIWTAIASAIGQGNPAVPAAVFPGGIGNVVGGILPGYSDGTSTRVTGSMTLSGGTLSGSFGLENSGLWQPNSNPHYNTTLPTASPIGEYVDASSTIPGEYALATIAPLPNANINQEFSFSFPGAFAHGNTFSYSNSLVQTNGIDAYAVATGPFSTSFSGPVVDFYANGAGNLTTNPNRTNAAFSLNGTVYDPVFLGSAVLYAQINFAGNVVATTSVPEPSSFCLAALGAGLAAIVYRRKSRSAC